MTLLEKICEELGVDVDEHWQGSDGGTYVFDEVGQLHCCDENIESGGYINVNAIIPKLLIGDLRPVWKPEKGDYYWTIRFTAEEIVEEYTWEDYQIENRLLERGLVFRTKEEAKEACEKMLSVLK